MVFALSLAAFLTGCGGGSSTPTPPAAPTVTISASPTSIGAGQSSTLTVTATNATSVVISNNVDSTTIPLAATGGTSPVTPTATTTYTATATGAGGTKTATATVTFFPAPTVTIAASPTTIFASQSSTLTVTATNATAAVTITGSDSSSYTLSTTGGTQSVSPSATTTYTATATGGASQTKTATATVTVTPTPTVTLASSTSSVISGQAVTLTATATNATQVVITNNLDATQYTLPGAGGTQVVNPTADITYTATASDSGGFNATATTSITTATALTPSTFEGIASSDVSSPGYSIDPNGAIGTKQYMQWVNVYFQAYNKQSPYGPVFLSGPQPGTTPWASLTNCSKNIQGDGVVLFDRLADRWVMAAHTSQKNNYYYCVAVSNTDDLNDPAFAWYPYEFLMNTVLGSNSNGNVYFPDWPKLGTWPDAYYMSADLNDVDNQFQEVGVLACAFDRADMLRGVAALAPICFSTPNPVTGSLYLAHSMVPADYESQIPPPTGRHEYYTSIQNPPNDGVSTTSNTINLWTSTSTGPLPRTPRSRKVPCP
jgi:hypothetical protein